MASAARVRAVMPVLRRHLATVDSTNTYAKKNAATFDPAAITLVTADEQTAGRGRSVRVWKSTGADVKATFTFQLPSDALATAYQLSPLLAIVARRALTRHAVELSIKWPNDLIISGCRKVGGILCELESVAGKYWVALGVGININSMPDELDVSRPIWPLTTLRAELGHELDVEAVTQSLAAEFAPALATFMQSGFAPFQSEYEAASVLLGKRIRFQEGTSPVVGVVESLGGDGKLYVKLDSGETRGFLSGEVSGIELVAGSGTMVEGEPDGH